MSPRGIALGVFLVGVGLGTLVDARLAGTPPVRMGGYWVLAGDFHVHAFPGDGALPPWEIRREAERRGLDVVAITNHNRMLASRLGRALSRRAGAPLVLAAEEVTTPGAHVVAAGIERPVDWRLPLPRLADAIHAQGGVAIAAHPAREFWAAFTDAALQKFDGAEVAHPMVALDRAARADLSAFYARARSLSPHLAPIGSSDFHVFAPMGWCRTYVLAGEPTESGVLDAIRRGRTVAVDLEGHAYGDPASIELVERGRAARASATEGDHRGWAAAASALAWVGLLGMVLLDDGRRPDHR
jgi:predicted metal-dependent phosphoesterase TrpH